MPFFVVKCGVVIGSGDLPDGFMPCDFRDPHLFCHDKKFYCLVAAKKQGGKGRLLLYRSDDLYKWSFLSDPLGFDSNGAMFECPCYIDSLGMIVVSDQLSNPKPDGCLNVHSTRYFLGKMDFDSGKFTVDSEGITDYGFDYYAPQSFACCPENVVLGWLNMWDRNVPSAKYGFAGMLSVPRKVSVYGGKVCQTPVVKKTKVFEATVGEKLTDNAIIGVIEIEAEGLEAFEMSLRTGENNRTAIKLDGGEWVFDRSKSGEEIVGAEKDELSLAGKRIMPRGDKEKTFITIVLDKYSVEFFEGGSVMSSTVYPPENADKIELTVKAKKCVYTRYAVLSE